MIGMFVFLYGIGSIDGLLFFDLYVILSLLMGIIFSVTVSGGNLNPAITLSNALKT
jgi:glycerol uptake facilitator-like aquaporin